MAPLADPGEIRRRYGLPEAVRVRADRREALAWLDGAKEAVVAVASNPDDLDRHAGQGRGPLMRVESQLGPLVVREYRKGGLARALRGRRFLGRWRPFDELVVLRRLKAVRVPVPRAVGAVVRHGWLGWRGFLLLAEVRDALDLESFLRAPAARPEWDMREVLEDAGRAVRALHDAGVDHPDLHPKNLLLDPESGGVLVIDLDRARAHDGPLQDDARLANLVRLGRAVEKLRLKGVRVGRRHAIRFLSAYGGSRPAGDAWLDRVRGRLRRGLAWRVWWWRVSGQVPRGSSIEGAAGRAAP